MPSDGDANSEIGDAMPGACQSSDPPATHATNKSAEHTDRAKSAGVTTDGSALAGGDPLVIDSAEFAGLLKVSTKTIGRWHKAKKLPAPIVIGRERRWLRRGVEDWLAAGAPSQREWERKK